MYECYALASSIALLMGFSRTASSLTNTVIVVGDTAGKQKNKCVSLVGISTNSHSNTVIWFVPF